jgi:hypothetical protein
MERLRLPEPDKIHTNLNIVCMLFIILCILGLYRRYIMINQQRERSYT